MSELNGPSRGSGFSFHVQQIRSSNEVSPVLGKVENNIHLASARQIIHRRQNHDEMMTLQSKLQGPGAQHIGKQVVIGLPSTPQIKVVSHQTHFFNQNKQFTPAAGQYVQLPPSAMQPQSIKSANMINFPPRMDNIPEVHNPQLENPFLSHLSPTTPKSIINPMSPQMMAQPSSPAPTRQVVQPQAIRSFNIIS